MVVFGRDSIDGLGATLCASVHFSRAFSNGYWDGERIVLGDGDGLMLLDFTRAPEFLGHEALHAVTQYTCRLEYEGEAGALNESLSDVLGSVFKQWMLGQTAVQADWLIGADIVGPSAKALGWTCVRSLVDPSSVASMTRQPFRFRDYVQGGGPHTNSGIPNNVLQRVAARAGGNSWETIGMVLYNVMGDVRCAPDIDFAKFSWLTIDVARRLCRNNPLAEQLEVAWSEADVEPVAP